MIAFDKIKKLEVYVSPTGVIPIHDDRGIIDYYSKFMNVFNYINRKISEDKLIKNMEILKFDGKY